MNDQLLHPLAMITGAVLSGGSSSRFGASKGLVKLDGNPMVSHVVRALREVADDILVAVAPGTASSYSDILDEDVLIVEDERTGEGPLQGLITSLEPAHGERVIVSPCDTPLLRTDVCRLLIEMSDRRDGAVPMIRGYLEPLHACYVRDPCLKAFRKTLTSGRRKPKDAYEHLDIRVVEEKEIAAIDPDFDSFLNINSRREFDIAEGRLLQRR
ncbi:MAG: molybdenum cofactor guanylyltransferase [Methanobacteriota archaeon]|nr:MAG: molybdenum cofactor guanylyltransferase [Euryarchaeota archaeon]